MDTVVGGMNSVGAEFPNRQILLVLFGQTEIGTVDDDAGTFRGTESRGQSSQVVSLDMERIRNVVDDCERE